MTKIIIKIDWDTEVDGEISSPEELNLPTEKTFTVNLPKEDCDMILEAIDIDVLIEKLSDIYGYCINEFVIEYKEA